MTSVAECGCVYNFRGACMSVCDWHRREFQQRYDAWQARSPSAQMMGGVYGMVCPYCGGAVGSFGPHICSTPPAPPVFMSDTDIEDQVRERIDTWSSEQQMIAYKYLHAQGLRVGSTLDHNLSEERRKRHLAEKQA